MTDAKRGSPGERTWPMSHRLARGLAVTVGVLVLLVAVILFFPWDLLRGPVNRYVSEQTGRQFEITRRLDVKPGWNTRVRLDGVTFANPEWARDRYLVQAESAEFEIRLLPLLLGRLELPSLVLQAPQLGLQEEADGRRTWALGRDTSDPATVPQIGSLEVDKGELHYVATAQGADIRMGFEISPRSRQCTAAEIRRQRALAGSALCGQRSHRQRAGAQRAACRAVPAADQCGGRQYQPACDRHAGQLGQRRRRERYLRVARGQPRRPVPPGRRGVARDAALRSQWPVEPPGEGVEREKHSWPPGPV